MDDICVADGIGDGGAAADADTEYDEGVFVDTYECSDHGKNNVSKS